MADYLVLEEDGTSKLTLEEDGGSLLLEESSIVSGEWVTAFAFPDAESIELSLQASFSTDPADEPVWENLSERVREVHLRLYRTTELDEFQPGEFTVVLSNADRALEPLFAGSSFYPGVLPRKRIRYRLRFDGVAYERLTGFITNITFSWPGQVDGVAVITAVDYSLILNRAQVTLNGFPEELVHERIERVLDAIGVPEDDRDLSTGTYTVAAIDDLDETSSNIQTVGALEHIQTCAKSDLGGYVFISRSGKVTFHDGHYRRENLGTPVGTFGDDPDASDEIPYTADLSGSLGDDRLWNRAAVITAAGVREEVSDSDSADGFWPARRDDFQSVLSIPGEAASLASLFVWRYKEPKNRLPRVNVILDPTRTGMDIDTLLAADVGTRFGLIRRPVGGGDPIEQEVHIEGITEDAVVGRPPVIGFDVSQADPDTAFWVLGTSTLETGASPGVVGY